VLLERIALQIVQFGPGRIDCLEAAVTQRAQGTPTETPGIQRFGIRFEIGDARQAAQRTRQADAVNLGNLEPEQVDHGRHDVGEPNDGVHLTRRDSRGSYDERYPEHALVHEDSVIALAVIAERLAVIGRDDDDRAVQEVATLERVEQAANLRVGKCDLADIRVKVTRLERLGWIVGPMRIVEVRPHEKRGLPDLVQPAHRVGHDLVSPTLPARRCSGVVRHDAAVLEPCARPRSGLRTTDPTNAPVRNPCP
jgi:hypothetical protein